MKATLIDLFTSKKFLAALTAVIVYVAGRFGFDVDTDTLDRIFAAFLVYIGAQSIADAGKSAEVIRERGLRERGQIAAARFESDDVLDRKLEAKVKAKYGGAAMVLVLLAITIGGTAPACATVRERATVGVGAMLDCQDDNLRAGVDELLPLATQAVLAAVSGDGRHVDTAPIRAAARALKSDLGRCALASAIAILATPRKPDPDAPMAAGLEIDPDALRAALESVRPELGGVTFRTRAGVL